MFRVTYFSFWQQPQHLENLSLEDKDEAVFEGQQQQYKVVVTLMDEEQPTTY